MRGGVYNNKSHHDSDLLLTARNIKLSTQRSHNISNHPLLSLHDNEYYDASFFVEEDDNFRGYVKLSLAEVKTNYLNLGRETRMNDGKHYLSSSKIMSLMYDSPVNKSKTSIQHYAHPFLGPCQKIDINGPARSIHHNKTEGPTKTNDYVHCFHYDM